MAAVGEVRVEPREAGLDLRPSLGLGGFVVLRSGNLVRIEPRTKRRLQRVGQIEEPLQVVGSLGGTGDWLEAGIGVAFGEQHQERCTLGMGLAVHHQRGNVPARIDGEVLR